MRPAGFEPATNSLEGCCSIHLSYGRVLVPNNLQPCPARCGPLACRTALKLRPTRPPAHPLLNDSSCPPAHNTLVPLERSAPASFKRMFCGGKFNR